MRRYLMVVLFTVLCLAVSGSPGFPQDEKTAVENSGASDNQQKDSSASAEKRDGKAKTDPTYAIDPVVVTATRTETPLSEVTKSIDVVTQKDMETQQQTFIPETLDTVPGVMFQSEGGPGQYSNINIRGAGSQHVQFQYNGIPLRDSADTQNTLQYFTENLYGGSGINRVEVLRGTNSTLYGSAAMGGVINIIPQKWKQGFSAELRNQMGEHNTFIENGSFSYGEENYYINFNPVYINTDGVTNGGTNGYWFNNLGFTGGGGIKFGDNIALEVGNITYSSDMALSSVNPSLNAQHQLVKNQASADEHRESMLTLTGLTFSHQLSPCWDYTIKGAYGNTERHYFWSGTAGDQSNYDGSTTYLETQHNIRPTDWLTVTLGFDYDGATYDGREPRDVSQRTYQEYNESWFGYDFFGQAQTTFFDKSLIFTGGLRFNDHEKFDPKVVGELSAAYIFKPTGTKLHTAFGTGYRTPSLYEIYGGYYYGGQVITIGNPKLKPEESTSYEVGITQPFWNDRIKVGVTWFHIDFDDLIIFDGFNYKYMNAQVGRSEGIEAKVETKLCKYVTLAAAYTYADSKYKETDSDEWQRTNYWPMNVFSFTGTFYPVERLTLAFKVSWESDKIVPLYDTSYNRVLWNESGSARVDLAATYKLVKNYKMVSDVDLFMRIENLLDEDYTESGYTMPGRWIYGGVKMAF